VSVILGISVGELTVQAAWVAALAILALTLAGWRKPARAAPLTPRAANDSPSSDERASGEKGSESTSASDDSHDHEGEPIAVAIRPVPLEHAPNFARRLVAGAAAAGLSVLTGTVLAILISFAAVVAVVWATNLLGR
jgi:hypothetical protein